VRFQKAIRVAKTKQVSEKQKGLSEIGTFFEASEIDLKFYISQSNINKLSEKLGKKINVISIAFVVPDTKSAIAIMADPKEENKSMLITSDKDFAKSFYNALQAVQKEREK
jgi:hypothetical protein